jgi:glucokinase
LRWKQTVLNAGHDSFASVIAATEELSDARIEAVGVGVAGPVDDGVCQMTNLDWTLDEAALRSLLSVRRAVVVNDLTAIAVGITHLPQESFVSLGEGERPWGSASMAVVAPGTGLGEAGLLWEGERHRVVPSETGHTDFAPANELEYALHAFLLERLGQGHVSWEHVISGPGLGNIATFLDETKRYRLPTDLAEMPERDRPAAIAERALAGSDALCVAALDLFASILARETGNAALRYLAVGGVCLAGGIPPAILPVLRRPAFLDTMRSKGPMTSLVSRMPVRVTIDTEAGLTGAAHLAGMTVG